MANVTKSASKTLTAPASSSAKYKLTASFEETSIDNTNNQSTIKVTATIASDSGYSFSGSTQHTLKIYWYDDNNNTNGNAVKTTNVTSINAGGSSTATGNITVTHKSDGTLKGYAKAVWTKSGSNSYVPPSGNVSTAETSLTQTAANPVFTTEPSITSVSETSIILNRGITNVDSKFSYSISPSGGTKSESGSTVTYTGLNAGTTYTITITAANTTNTSKTTSKTVSSATWMWPTISSISATTLVPGNSQTIYLNNPHGRSITWYMRSNSTSKNSGAQVTTGTTTGTSVTFTPAVNTLFNATNGLGTTKTSVNAFYYIDYNGNISSITGTVAISEANYKPTWGSVSAAAAIKYQDTNTTAVTVTGSNQKVIAGKSTLQYQYVSSGHLPTANRSTISKYQMSINGSSYEELAVDTLKNYTVPSTATGVTFSLIAIDARGFKSDPLTLTIANSNFYKYANPTGTIEVKRLNNYGTQMQLKINPVWAVSNNNASRAKIEYKTSSASSWTTLDTGYTTFGSLNTISGTYANESTYNFRVTLYDQFGGTSSGITATVGPGVPIMFIDSTMNSVGFRCFPRSGSAMDVNGPAYFSDSGILINEKRIFQKFDMDLSSLSSTNFYPITFEGTSDEIHCEIHSPSSSSSAAYNQNIIIFNLVSQGWSDAPKTLNITNYSVYDVNEITIGCIGNGTKGGCNAIWLRGGLNYKFFSNIKPTLHKTDWSNGSGNNVETFTVGTDYYGGTNTNVNILFTPQSTITKGAYSSMPIKASSFSGNATSATNSTSAYKLTAPGSSRPTSANLNHEYTSNRATKRLDLVSNSMTAGKPDGNGWIETYFSDDANAYDSQFFIPNATSKRVSVRSKANAENWPSTWKELAYLEDVPTLPADTGWKNITLGSGIQAGTYGTPQYRKIGNQVYLRGSYKGTKGSGTLALGTLPTGYIPPKNVYVIATLGGHRITRIYITSEGNIGVDWIYTLSSNTEWTGDFSWLEFETSFWID